MAENIIPKSHYFKSPTSATPFVFNRILDDINNGFNKLWDGSVSCDPEHDVIILDRSNALTPATVKILDTTFWPNSVKNVNLSFALDTGSTGSITPGSNSKGGYAIWNPPVGGYTWTAGKAPIQIVVKMTATYDVERIADETLAGNGTANYTVKNAPDPTSVEAWIDNIPVTVSNVSGTTVTLGTTASSGQSVRIRYIWLSSQTKTTSTGFLIMAEPDKGDPAITSPVPVIYAPTTVSALYGKSDGSVVAELEFEDKSFVNATDTVIREWELYTESDQVTNIIATYLATGYNAGNISASQNGDSKIVINFTTADTYIVKLRVSSNTYGEVSTTTKVRILPLWQVEPNYLMDISNLTIAQPNAIKYSISDHSPRETGTLNYYLAEPHFVTARLTAYFGIENENAAPITVVTNNGDGTYTIQFNGVPTSRYNMNNDIRAGIDFFWLGSEPYAITAAQEQGDLHVTIKPDTNQPAPTSSWIGRTDIAIGPTADQYIGVVELYDANGSSHIRDIWRTIQPRKDNSQPPIFHIDFTEIPYDSYVNIKVWGRYGNVLTTSQASNQFHILPATQPGLSGYSMAFPTGSNTVVMQLNGAINTIFYEIEYQPDPTLGVTTVRSTKPVLALPVTPNSTGSTCIFRAYDKYGQKYEASMNVTWADGASNVFP